MENSLVDRKYANGVIRSQFDNYSVEEYKMMFNA